jgi:hypothetical protein
MQEPSRRRSGDLDEMIEVGTQEVKRREEVETEG